MMGAELAYITVRTQDKEAVKKRFDDSAEQSRYEDGHLYSGGIGMMHSIAKWVNGDRTQEQAVDFLMENHKKWDDAMAVQFQDGWVVGGWASS